MAHRTDAAGPSLALWSVALGAVGFACGFFGPIVLAPDANQGPLLGLLVTGPGGVVLGFVAGLVARLLPIGAAARRRLLVAACAALAVAVLYAALPAPAFRGEIVEGEVSDCAPQSAKIDDAIARWDAWVADARAAKVRPWKEEIPTLLRDDEGVVLELLVLRSRAVYERQEPWARGVAEARLWQPAGATRSYYARFAGGSCADYYQLGRRLYFPTSEPAAQWPPEGLPGILQLQVLGPVPDRYQSFAGP
jgi:hypothetical protein